ncbi:MAG: hypothetical protein KC620_01605 [Myxococcales bacterium]|nr:hypothetical protein [Myxococcales bacterium]
MRRNLIIGLFGLWLSACVGGGGGDGSNNGGGDGGEPPPGPVQGAELPPAAIRAIAEIVCIGAIDCNASDGLAGLLRLFAQSGGNCTDYFTSAISTADAAADLARQFAYTRIDSAALTRCRDAVRQRCVPPQDEPACDAAFTGLLAAGQPCDEDEWCAPGHYCEIDFNVDACLGSCAAARAEGEYCDVDEDCAHPPGQRARCVNNVCTGAVVEAGAALGMPCGELEGDPRRLVTCARGLWCNTSTDPGVCATPIAAGQPCEADSAVCAPGTACFNDTCLAVTVRNQANQPCDLQRIEVCNPMLRLLCVDGQCVNAGAGRIGDACQGEIFGVSCQGELYCDRDTGRCTAKRANGEACELDDECQSDQCDFLDGQEICAEDNSEVCVVP